MNEPVHALTSLGETVGLGYVGNAGNLVTDALALPSAVTTGGAVEALSGILHDVGASTTAAGNLAGSLLAVPGNAGGLGVIAPVLDGVAGVTTNLGHAVEGITGPLQIDPGAALLGPGAPLQPVANLANAVIDGVHGSLETVGHDIPVLSEPIHAVIDLGTTAGFGTLGETGNLVTDAVNLPGAVLGGQAPEGVAHVVTDLGQVADAAGGVAGSVLGGLTGAGGADANGLGDFAQGVVQALTGTAGGAGTPLVTVTAGPETAAPLFDLPILAPASATSHAVQVDAIGGGSSLAALHLLDGDSIALPSLSGAGADALVGALHDAAAPAGALIGSEAAHGSSLDLGIAGLDIGGPADAPVADAGHHAAAPVAHLLGL